MAMNTRRAAYVARWYYTRHFLGELVPFALCIFVVTGLAWFCIAFWWLVTCAATFWQGPWCT